MNDVPVQLIVAAFQDEKAADDALKELKSARKEKLIDIQDAAVIRRDEKNKLHIKETADPGGGRGAAAGGAIGAIIGLIGGPAGVVVGGAAGALVGGVTAKVIDSGIPDDRLKQIGEGLKPGTSAIVAIIEHRWVEEVQNQLAETGADVLTEDLRDDIAEQLAAGKDVAFSAVAADGVVAVERVAAGEDEADVERLIATDEGVVSESVVITRDEVAEDDAETSAEEGDDHDSEEKTA
jgi:uncharacterized membrane protein